MDSIRKLQQLKAVYQKFGKKELPILTNLVVRRRAFDLPRRTLAHQPSLPRLPVPLLKSTLEKYLRFVEPLLSSEDFQYTHNVVEKFLSHPGPSLQEKLVEKSKKTENWLADWWLDVAYLEYRSPLVVHVNPGLRLPLETFKTEDDWLTYAARFVSGVLDIKNSIDEQRVPVDYMGKHPLCMMQYYSVLNSCRIPGGRKDKVLNFSNRQGEGFAKHIIVMHNNRMFSLDLYDADRNSLTAAQIFQQLKRIVARSQIKGPPIGLMTAENRNVWSKAYKRLRTDLRNVETFNAIHSSIFMLCLDQPVLDDVPEAEMDSCISKNMLHGGSHKSNSANRWFDKTIQFIISRDGACGFNYEHSPAEGPPVVTIVDHVYQYMKEHANDPVSDGAATNLPAPEEIKFRLDSETKSDLSMAKTNIYSIVNDLQLTAFTEKEFGKNYSKRHRLSPDGFIQMAFQLAFYRIYGIPCASYESGSLRRFALGRTDTIRACGPISVSFTKVMSDEKSSNAERAEAIRSAINEHSRHTMEVLVGEGIDRHLLGLKLTAIERGDDLPEFYMDNAYNKMFHFRISTSQVPAKVDASLCFGPAVPDGYGICYNPQSDRVHITVTAFNTCPTTDSDHFAMEIRKAFRDMKSALESEELRSRL